MELEAPPLHRKIHLKFDFDYWIISLRKSVTVNIVSSSFVFCRMVGVTVEWGRVYPRISTSGLIVCPAARTESLLRLSAPTQAFSLGIFKIKKKMLQQHHLRRM